MSIKFELGQVVATPGALGAMRAAGRPPSRFLDRNLAGDWGDLCEEEKALNDEALVDGSKILSSYELRTGIKVWLITEATDDDGRRAYCSRRNIDPIGILTNGCHRTRHLRNACGRPDRWENNSPSRSSQTADTGVAISLNRDGDV